MIIHSLAFASEGPPHDEGLPLGRGMLEEWKKLCFEGGTTTFTAYTPKDFAPEDRWAVKKYSRQHFMPGNPGYSNTGLGAWKAVMMRKACETAQDGDIVFYHDINFKKYPHTKVFAQNLRICCSNLLQHTDFFMPPHVMVGHHCGVEILKFLFPNNQEAIDVIIRAPLGRGRIFIFVVNEKTRNFIRLAENILKENPLLLSPVEKTGYPGIRLYGNTAEQAFFTVLAYREGLFPMKWRGTWIERLRNAGLEPGSGVVSIMRFNQQNDLQDNCVEFILGSSSSIMNFNSAIIIQGNYIAKHTENTVRIFLERNPKSLVIVSTYAPSDESSGEQLFGTFLSNFEKDNVIHNTGKYVGQLIYIFVRTPAKELYPDFWKTNFQDQNLQRLSSFVGLSYAHGLGIPFCLRVTSDAFLGRHNICDYLTEKISPLTTIPCGKIINLKSRLVASDRSKEKNGIYDKWLYGRSEDLLKFYDIRPGCAWEEGNDVSLDFTKCWMKNVGIPECKNGFGELAARYLVIVDSVEIEFISQKEESLIRYQFQGKDYIKERGPKFFTVEQWQRCIASLSDK